MVLSEPFLCIWWPEFTVENTEILSSHDLNWFLVPPPDFSKSEVLIQWQRGANNTQHSPQNHPTQHLYGEWPVPHKKDNSKRPKWLSIKISSKQSKKSWFLWPIVPFPNIRRVRPKQRGGEMSPQKWYLIKCNWGKLQNQNNIELFAVYTLRMKTTLGAIPEHININLSWNTVTVKGSRGTLGWDFSHINVELSLLGKKGPLWVSKKKMAVVFIPCQYDWGHCWTWSLLLLHPFSLQWLFYWNLKFLMRKNAHNIWNRSDVLCSELQAPKDELNLEGNDIKCMSNLAALS